MRTKSFLYSIITAQLTTTPNISFFLRLLLIENMIDSARQLPQQHRTPGTTSATPTAFKDNSNPNSAKYRPIMEKITTELQKEKPTNLYSQRQYNEERAR